MGKKPIGLTKKFIWFFPYNGSSSTQLSLTSFEVILLDCIVTAVISVHFFKKLIKIGELLCSHFNTEMEENMQHFQHIMLYYFKKGKNATETQKKICAVYGKDAVID